MRLGIFGWSQSGKTTVFEVLTGAGAAAGRPPAGKARDAGAFEAAGN